MRILFTFLLLTACIFSNSQLIKRLKDKAVSDGKAKVKSEVRSTVRDEMQNYRAEFDSADFDYALLLSDNSGLFNTKKKGEFANRFIALRNIGRSIKDIDLSDAENAKLNLEMGQAAYASEKFVYAEKRFTAARAYFEKAYMTSDFGYLKTVANQGLLYTTMGRFSQAEEYTSSALSLRQQKLGETNMSVAASFNNYGVLHYNVGKYNESEKDFEAALSVIRKNKQDAEMPYAIVLNNQAMLFQGIGRYDAAVKTLDQSIAIVERLENSKSRNHQLFLSNLALLYQQMGKYPEAEKIYLGLERRFDKTKPEYANLLNNFAALYMLMDRKDKVEDMLKQSAAIFKISLTENSPAYAKVISDLGNYYRYQGRYADATQFLENALSIREATLETSHPYYVQSQEDLAILHWKKKENDNAYQLYHNVMEKTLDFINKYFTPMSEAEKTKYWDMISPRFERFYNFALETGTQNPQVLTDMFEYRLATKGILLNSARKITQSIHQSGNEQLISDYEAWIDSKEQLTRLYIYSKEELIEQSINIDSLEAVTNAMEKKLSGASKEFAQFFFAGKTSLKDVQAKLKTDQALVEIIRMRNFSNNLVKEPKYVAVIVTKSGVHPKMISMPSGTDMEGNYFKGYKRGIVSKAADEQSYNHFWAPLDKELGGKKDVYVSLDGVYNQISLNTLKKPGGDYLLNNYNLILVGSPRDIIKDDSKTPVGSVKHAILIGYPEYGSANIPQLPGTKVEVDGINKVLKSSGYQVEEYLQKNATETNLKQSKKISVLHIATHGYFLQDVERASWPIGVHSDNAKANVLLRSGLMLTGASEDNHSTAALDSLSNGIITSYEAMNLDLKGTNLVVLSACETGLGEVKAGEGVYGLQRAFMVAGAQAIIMSLWKVDDVATQQLMNNFYTNWIQTGDKQKAFRTAQAQLMTKYKHPFFWGAFVLMEE